MYRRSCAARPAFHLLDKEIDLAFGDLHLVVHLALPQPRHDHLLAHVVAEGIESHAILLERLAEVGQRQLVRLRDALDRSIDLYLVDAKPGLARHLQLGLVEDQPLEHLALEHRPVRSGRALAGQLALRHSHGLVQL